MTAYILLALLGLTLAVGFAMLNRALTNLSKQVVATFSEINDVWAEVKDIKQHVQAIQHESLPTIDGHIDENHIALRNRLDERLDQIALQASQNKDTLQADLLEMTTAITKAFMEETIEIKAGVEAIVDVLSNAAAPAQPSGQPCQVKGCQADGTVEVPYSGQQITVCEQHAQVIAQTAMRQPAKKRQKVLCEDGYDHSDDPDYVPGQIHAHVEIPDKDEFLAAEGLTGEPDTSTMKPEPLDPISAAIEAAYQSKKAEIDAALDRK